MKLNAEIDALALLKTMVAGLTSVNTTDAMSGIFSFRLAYEGLMCNRGTLLQTFAKEDINGDVVYDSRAESIFNVWKRDTLTDEIHSLTIQLIRRALLGPDNTASGEVQDRLKMLLELDLQHILQCQKDLSSDAASSKHPSCTVGIAIPVDSHLIAC